MKRNDPHIALSLFSGAGGMDIGIQSAGFKVLAQIEIDEHCCNTLRAAKEREGRSTLVLQEDIRKLSPHQVCKELGLQPGQLDLLCGGPPCQSFSQAGKKLGLGDERGMLLFEMIRFAEEFKPKVILIEQVKGLLTSKGINQHKGEVFNKLINALTDIGYLPKWKVISSADFGVPQLRERLFIVATRGQNGFSFPERTHAPLQQCQGLFPYLPYRNIASVLSGLGEPSKKIKGCKFYDREDSHIDVTPNRDRERIAYVPEGSYLASQTHLDKNLLKGLKPKDTTKYLRLHREKPSNTLRCGEIFYHPTQDRYLTPREYMRIHGYPDSYLLLGPIRSRTGTVKNLDQHRQVANSVPPPLAEILGNKILDYLNEQNL